MSTSSRSGRLLIILAIFVLFAPARAPWAVSGQAPQSTQTQAQQRPLFRGGTRFVRVDAYPVENGKIVEGLRPQDFEILEDGKPQTIDSLDFIRFDTWTAEAERRDPVSQQAGFDLAADPRYRVFVVYVDLTFTTSMNGIENLPLIQQPLVNFLERVIGPQDLYGLMTTRNSVKDLVLGQKTTVTVSEIKDLLRAKFIDARRSRRGAGDLPVGASGDRTAEGSLSRRCELYQPAEPDRAARLASPGAQEPRARDQPAAAVGAQ